MLAALVSLTVIFTIALHSVSGFDTLPTPTVTSTSTNVSLGEAFNLTCRLEILGFSTVDLDWDFPATEEERPYPWQMNHHSPRVSVDELPTQYYRDTGTVILEKRITVRRAKGCDAGAYICTASSHKTRKAAMIDMNVAGGSCCDKPVLHIHKMQQRVHGTLEISCTGSSPLKWTYPHFPNLSTIRQRRNIVEKYENEVYNSTIIFKNLQATEVGFFKCQYSKRRKCSSEQFSKVYLYVKDPKNALAPHKFTPYPNSIQVNEGQRLIIPCRPTFPEWVTVHLYKVRKHRDMEEVKVGAGGEVTFHPMVGFIIEYATRFYDSRFQCMGVLNGPNGNYTETQVYILMYQQAMGIPRKPEITESDSGYHYMVPAEIKLSCLVRVSQKLYTLDWEYPNMGRQDQNHRILLSEVMVDEQNQDAFEYYVIRRTLIIKRSQKSDTGVYRCTVTRINNKGLSNSVEQFVTVHDKTTLDMHAVNPVVEAELATDSASMVARFEGFPAPAIFWYRDDVEIIDAKGSRYTRRDDKDKTEMFIHTPELGDTGRYKVVGHTRDVNKTVYFDFRVVTTPTSNISTSSDESAPYFLVGRTHSIYCHTSGHPAPTIRWQWQPCWTPGCPVREDSWKYLDEKEWNIETGDYVSVLRVWSAKNATGQFRCEAENSQGVAIDTLMFLPTDVPNGLGHVINPGRNPIEQDDFTLSCLANKLMFQPVKMYRRLVMRSISIREPVKADLQTKVYNNSSPYSYNITIRLPRIGLDAEGTYYCETESVTGVSPLTARFKKGIKVDVEAIKVPVFQHQLESEYYVQYGASPTFKCQAWGRPQPIMHWYKDGRLLKPKDGYEFGEQAMSLKIVKVSKSDQGTYVCTATNRGGKFNSTMDLHVKGGGIADMALQGAPGGLTSQHMWIIVGSCIAFLIIVICLMMLVWRVQHQKQRNYLHEMLYNPKGEINPDIPIDEQTQCLPYDPKWEFPRDRLKLGLVLGQGAFGKVVRAEATCLTDREPFTTVAVKMAKDDTDHDQLMALMSELKILAHIGHHLNVVNLLGACTKEIRKGELYVIVEYCCKGNLRNFLIRNRANFKDDFDDRLLAIKHQYSRSVAVEEVDSDGYLVQHNHASDMTSEDEEQAMSTRDLMCYAFQVARGMEYLASRKYIHRDLAARNCLLAENNVVKICDFGLAKDLYKYQEYTKKTDGPLPVKWMAIESLLYKVFSSKSDVWSFGILMWELFTLGANPYPGLRLDETFIIRLRDGYRMQRPEFGSESIYALMLECWQTEPEDRPDFSQLADRLGALLEANVKSRYIDLNTPYLVLQDTDLLDTDLLLHDSSRPRDSQFLDRPQGQYLAMNSDGYIMPISQTSVETVSVNLDDSAEPQYLNSKRYSNADYRESYELKPMLGDDKKDLRVELDDGHVKTTAIIHGGKIPEKSPTGSASSNSSYNSTTSSSSDGYLVPIVRKPAHSRRMGNSMKSTGSTTSEASSGFHSDYANEEFTPPEYTRTVEMTMV